MDEFGNEIGQARMAATAQQTRKAEEAPMKSRVITIISLLALVVAMTAAGTASAQSTPAQDVYNSNGQVLDVVQGGGSNPAPDNKVKDNVESGQAPSTPAVSAKVCSAADSRDAHGNTVAYGSSADCATATPSVSSGQLPFTGFQAGLVGLAGVALLGSGFAMRRVARRDAA
jgi:hypothetical protein